MISQREQEIKQIAKDLYDSEVFADLIDEDVYEANVRIRELRDSIFVMFSSPAGQKVMGFLLSEFVFKENATTCPYTNSFNSGARHVALMLFRVMESARKEKGYVSRIDPIDAIRAAERLCTDTEHPDTGTNDDSTSSANCTGAAGESTHRQPAGGSLSTDAGPDIESSEDT